MSALEDSIIAYYTNIHGPNPDKWNWYIISCKALSEGAIREFQNHVNWNNISSYQKLSENFIREFQDKVKWDEISQYQKLSENFIKEFRNKVNWYYISKYQKLSEDLIKEFKDWVVWYNISIYQTLSEGFIREFKDEIDMDLLIKLNKSCSPDFRIRYMIDNNMIKKQDPNTHDFEYEAIPIAKIKTDNSLQLLKELIC